MLRRWTSDPAMMRHITGSTWTDADRDRFSQRQRTCLETSGVCFGAAEWKPSGEIVGIAGLAPLERLGDWQVGWWVDPEWQGRGLGTEFAESLIDYALNVANRERALAVISPANAASRRVAEKAGMRLLGTVRANTLETRWNDEDVLLYESRRSGRTP